MENRHENLNGRDRQIMRLRPRRALARKRAKATRPIIHYRTTIYRLLSHHLR